jgi:ATP-binding cassette subfamily F protein 3
MLQRLSPTIKEQVMRDFLGGFGFIGDEALAICEDFSGGEKARLALALLAWQKPNVLLLDEPTNHLDIDMRSALTLALQAFEGAVLIVSHDRHLLMSSVDDYVLVADGQVRTFDGDLEDYAQWMKSRNQVQQALLKAESQPTTTPMPKTTVKPQKVKLSYKEEKELATLPDHIAQLEADQHQLSEQLSDGKVLSNKTEVLRIQQRLSELDQQLTQAMERWEVLETKTNAS